MITKINKIAFFFLLLFSCSAINGMNILASSAKKDETKKEVADSSKSLSAMDLLGKIVEGTSFSEKASLFTTGVKGIGEANKLVTEGKKATQDLLATGNKTAQHILKKATGETKKLVDYIYSRVLSGGVKFALSSLLATAAYKNTSGPMSYKKGVFLTLLVGSAVGVLAAPIENKLEGILSKRKEKASEKYKFGKIPTKEEVAKLNAKRLEVTQKKRKESSEKLKKSVDDLKLKKNPKLKNKEVDQSSKEAGRSLDSNILPKRTANTDLISMPLNRTKKIKSDEEIPYTAGTKLKLD